MKFLQACSQQSAQRFELYCYHDVKKHYATCGLEKNKELVEEKSHPRLVYLRLVRFYIRVERVHELN